MLIKRSRDIDPWDALDRPSEIVHRDADTAATVL